MISTLHNHETKFKQAIAAVLAIKVVNKFFETPEITEDELMDYIKQITGHDDGLTNLVCFMFREAIAAAHKEA